MGKCDSVFGYEPKTTPTVKYRRLLNIISPKMRLSIEVFHKQNLIFQILLTPIINYLTILSTYLIEKYSSLNEVNNLSANHKLERSHLRRQKLNKPDLVVHNLKYTLLG